MRNMKADAVDGLDQAFRKIEMHTQVPDVENTAAHSRSSGGKACMPICAALARVTALVATPLRSAAARARCTRDGKPVKPLSTRTNPPCPLHVSCHHPWLRSRRVDRKSVVEGKGGSGRVDYRR